MTPYYAVITDTTATPAKYYIVQITGDGADPLVNDGNVRASTTNVAYARVIRDALTESE